jgi:hypothetical protein
MVANPVRFVRREESDAGVAGWGAREDGEDARRRWEQEGRRDGASNAMNLLNQDKRKMSLSGDTHFVSYWHLRYDTTEVLLN